jgi:hypothetical protein
MRSFEEESVPMKQSEAVPSLLAREEQIRRRAYELYLERKRGDGHDVEDWLDAEAELRSPGEAESKVIAA